MSISEEDLRRQLETIAAQAASPAFTIGEVADRIRRRRTRYLWLTWTGAALVLAAAVALPVALTTSSGPALRPSGAPSDRGIAEKAPQVGPVLGPTPTPTGPVTQPSPVIGPVQLPPDLNFAVTMNGLPPTVPPHQRPQGCLSPSTPCLASPAPGFAVSPGERLNIRVTVGIPVRARLDGLWVGISNGTLKSPDEPGGPFGGLRPILLHMAGLNPGKHTVWFGWTVPAQTPFGTVMLLSASWTVVQNPTATPPTGQARSARSDEATDLVALYVSRR